MAHIKGESLRKSQSSSNYHIVMPQEPTPRMNGGSNEERHLSVRR